MPYEYIQKDLNTMNYSDNDLHHNNSAEAQLLVAEAYLEDRKIWESKLRTASLNVAKKTQEVSDLTSNISKQSKVKSFIFKLLKIKTKQEARLAVAKNELEDLKKQFIKINSLPPSIDAYDLAILGNNLFKAR